MADDIFASIYYRVYHNERYGPMVVCMQWFDESDYTEDRFLTDERFATEAEAQAWLDRARWNALRLLGFVR